MKRVHKARRLGTRTDAEGSLMSLPDRTPAHYEVHCTEAEYIALKMLAKRQERHRQPTVTLRHFSWEKKQDA